jgi:hypothetical protein
METLQERANKIEAKGIYLGGIAKRFENAGRTLLITLLSEGLIPNSKVLDIGCGCLRGGYWLIHFLDKDCYFGIEPNKEMLAAGIQYLLEPGLLEDKNPHFDHNADFNLAVFKEKFDFLVALSIWTHASKPQIQSMLDGFVSTANTNAVFITSYYRATLFKPDYKGASWFGRGNPSQPHGMIHHSLGWIKAECEKRALVAQEVPEKAYQYWNQTWLRISHKGN